MSIRCFVPLALAAFVAPLTAAGVRAADSTPVVAHIKLSGDLDEAPVSDDPLFGGVAENFKSKLDRIHKAAKDDAVKALYLEIDGVTAGWGKLDELTRAVAEFRKTGKKAYAYMEGGDAKDYLLATACDEICAPESGWILLTGVRAEVTFYKDLLDKIGVKADILRMGEAKSAAEAYTQTKMSAASRKQLEGVVNDYYENSMVGRIVKNRAAKNFTADQVKKLIDEGPYAAHAAEKAGLIDRVVYKQDLEDSFKKDLKVESVDLVRNYGQAKSEEIDLSSPFAIFKLLSPSKSTASDDKPKIAVIYAVGVINSGKSTPSPVRRGVVRLADDDRGDPAGREGQDGQGDRAARGQPRRIGVGERPDLERGGALQEAGDRQHVGRGGQRRLLHCDGRPEDHRRAEHADRLHRRLRRQNGPGRDLREARHSHRGHFAAAPTPASFPRRSPLAPPKRRR